MNETLPATIPIFSASHAYCEVCKDIRPCVIEKFEALDYTQEFVGADMICDCSFVIATLYNRRSPNAPAKKSS